jgi:hypothetical protein
MKAIELVLYMLAGLLLVLSLYSQISDTSKQCQERNVYYPGSLFRVREGMKSSMPTTVTYPGAYPQIHPPTNYAVIEQQDIELKNEEVSAYIQSEASGLNTHECRSTLSGLFQDCGPNPHNACSISPSLNA